MPSHKIMIPTCQTIQCHYEASQYRVYNILYPFNSSLLCSHPPSSLSLSLHPCLVLSLPRSFPSSTPSLNPPSLPPLPLAPSVTSSLPPSLLLFLPNLPLLPPSHPPSFLAPSLPLPTCLSACLPPSNSMYTVCMCVWRAALGIV